VIQPDQNGLLVPAGDPKALAARIERLLSSPADGIHLGVAARETIRNGPTPTDVVHQYIRILKLET
jgi:hypothetical protein